MNEVGSGEDKNEAKMIDSKDIQEEWKWVVKERSALKKLLCFWLAQLDKWYYNSLRPRALKNGLQGI